MSVFRRTTDKAFTSLTYISVALLTLMLLGILGPMIYRGAQAVLFTDTIEFRKMQLDIFDRGDSEEVQSEIEKTEPYRQAVYQKLYNFKKGVDSELLIDEVKNIHRDLGEQLRYRNVPRDEYTSLRRLSRDIRKKLEEAFVSFDRQLINENIDYAMEYSEHAGFEDTFAENYFTIARQFRVAVSKIDLQKRESYKEELAEVEGLIRELLGPLPGEDEPPLAQDKYGATRQDVADRLLYEIKWDTQWVEVEPGKPLEKVRKPRAEQFAGTELEPLFAYVEENSDAMLGPRFTFYWQYYIDDSTNGHYFGGVGPEVLGTLVLTAFGMLFAVPVGVITAAYLVECAGDNIVVSVIRMCINTLAGVPSIVFGLFGLAFFVLYVMPLLNFKSKPCILTASLTLAILTLPVIIRASEEAIRAVPDTYREASLGLGAGRFITFVKVTLPAAMPGILTGIILSLSRIAGETAPILFTGAVAFGSIPNSLLDPTRTLSYGSYDMAVGDRIAMQVPHKQYGMVLTLILLILLLNTISIILRSKMSRKLRGA